MPNAADSQAVTASDRDTVDESERQRFVCEVFEGFQQAGDIELEPTASEENLIAAIGEEAWAEYREALG